jgi:hypothetical protein
VGAIWELAMTTKELCDALRNTHPSRTMCKEAADVIERLAEELQYQYACDKAQQREIERLSAPAQPDAEPVAWRWRDNRYSLEQYGGRWQGPSGDPNEARWRSGLSKYTVEPLYAMRGSCCSPKAQLAPTCPDQTGGNGNAYYPNVASAKASPSYQHAPICKCRGLD